MTSTDAAAPGSHRGPETGSIPASPFAAFSNVSASRPSNTTSPRKVFGGADPAYAHISTLIAAIGTSDASGRPTPLFVGVAGRSRGHREGADDLRTVVGIAVVVGVVTNIGTDVGGAVTLEPPDEHAENATNNEPTPRRRSRRRITPGV